MTESHAVDVYVSLRMRQRRTLLAMSQTKLGDAVGLTFQQVQKYERGFNRMGSSRLCTRRAERQRHPHHAAKIDPMMAAFDAIALMSTIRGQHNQAFRDLARAKLKPVTAASKNSFVIPSWLPSACNRCLAGAAQVDSGEEIGGDAEQSECLGSGLRVVLGPML